MASLTKVIGTDAGKKRHGNPLLWTSSDLKTWLETFEHGKFKELIPSLKPGLTGRAMYDMSNEAWLDLKPEELALIFRYIFMGMCAIEIQSSKKRIESKQKELPVDASGNYYSLPSPALRSSQVGRSSRLSMSQKKTKPCPFPKLFPRPPLWLSIFTIVFIVACVLLCTVFHDSLQKFIGHLGWKTFIEKLSIPVISILFTYAHIWVALWMTFYPLVYFGCWRIPGTNVGFGWEGIIPFKGEKMARTSVKIMTTQLMNIKEVFSRIDPQVVVVEMEPVMYENVRMIVETMAQKYNPTLWGLLPQSVKNEIIEKVKEEYPRHIEGLMNEIKENIEYVFDLEDMVVSNLMRDKQLLVNMFVTCGYSELAFIRNSGAWMGGIFGIIQMILSIYTPNVSYKNIIVFPVFGLVVGTITNWLALKMIFEPVNPVKFGCWTLQGLFLKRQHEVAAEYGRMVAADVLTSRNIIEAILKGPASDKLFKLVYANVRHAVDAGSAITDRIVSIGIGEETYKQMKEDIVELVVVTFPDSLRQIEDYTTEALDLEVTLRDKMRMLTAAQFENLLHPVFQEDEWKLVLMGGALGLVLGFVQAFGINADALNE